MTEPGGDLWDKAQWAFTTILGIAAFFYGIWVKYVYDELKTLRDRQDTIAKESEMFAGKGDDAIWKALENIEGKLDRVAHREEVNRLQAALEDDRKMAAADRANIAVMMATKGELERQLDKLFNRLMDNLQHK